MEKNRNTLEQLKSLDENALRALIDRVARAGGMSEGMRRAAVGHTAMIKRKLASATEADLRRAMEKLGRERSEQILRELEK